MRATAVICHVAYFALYVAPIALAVSFNFVYIYWLVSGVAIATLVVWLWNASVWHRLLALALNAGSSLATFVLASSLYVQGTGFNGQFFHHLDGATFAIAREAYAPIFFGTWAYWLVLCVWPTFLGRHEWIQAHMGARVSATKPAALPDDAFCPSPSRPRTPPDLPLARQVRTPGRLWGAPRRVALAVGVGVVAYAPLLSLLAYAFSRLDETQATTVVPKSTHGAIEVDSAADPKSLVLIFAESLEATYSRTDVFDGDLTPRLTALARQGTTFEDIREVNNTGSTITGMVGALCALPLRSPMAWEHVNTVLPNVDAPLPGAACLGDILSAHGYRTVFFGGAPLAFAGKGNFLAAHGFQERYGTPDLLPHLAEPSYRSGWGIHDDTLFDFAMDRLEELSPADEPDSTESPFALLLLTLDTHHPKGLPSASCPARNDEGTDMEFAIRCSDKLIADFVETVRARFDDVVVALFSDHLAHRNELFATLRKNADARRLRFAVWGPDIEAVRVERRGTHFDVMPTLLDFLGFEKWLRHNLGASLLRYESPWFTLDPESSAVVTQSLPPIRLEPGARIVFEAKGPTIHVDGRRVLASNEGLALVDAIFAMEFDAAGNIVGFRDGKLPDRFVPAGDGILVGVSTNRKFNERLVPDSPTKTTFFAGRLDAGNLVAGPLWWRETVGVSVFLDGGGIEKP